MPIPTAAPTGISRKIAAGIALSLLSVSFSRRLSTRRRLPQSSLSRFRAKAEYVPAPPEFLQDLHRICREHGILFITDEVQSGMGRTGKWWAGDHAGLEPDILCVAKGIASGLPLCATIARSTVMDWKPGAHASTFGGNPVSVAAALVTLRLVEERYMENARRMGEYIFGRLAGWRDKFRIVGDVRGEGLNDRHRDRRRSANERAGAQASRIRLRISASRRGC